MKNRHVLTIFLSVPFVCTLFLLFLLPTSAVAFDLLALNTPSLKHTVDVSATYQLTPSPTPMLAVEAKFEKKCVTPSKEEVLLSDQAVKEPLLTEDILAYLDKGGSLDKVKALLNKQSLSGKPYLWQLLEEDLTNDGISDIFLAVTRSYQGGDGETYLLMFYCIEGHYQQETLFVRAGAGSRGSGLYAGGGVRIISIHGLNHNGSRDILISVNWADPREYVEYYLYEWHNGEWVSLFPKDPLADDYAIRGNKIGGLQIVNQDNDGVFELIIDGTLHTLR